MASESAPTIDNLAVSAYAIPTASPESDGTLEWNHTTIVVAEARAAGICGIGYTYADISTALLIETTLKKIVLGRNALSIAETWDAMVHEIRNLGRAGICSMAIAAVDNALWDLKARLLNLSLVDLLGKAREAIPAYGSGGFTSYSIDQLHSQLCGWAAAGMDAVKMKIGRDPDRDLARVLAARKAIGPDTALYVDANGAYNRKRALEKARRFADLDVTWFEEPVSSDDLEGLRLIRDQGPPGVRIAAGEYGYDAWYFRRMLEAGSVDVLQADATRCAGVTGFLEAAALCQGFPIPFSAHTAPALHAHLCCAVPCAIEPVNGMLCPDSSRPGIGVELKRADIEKYQVYTNS